MAHQIERLAVLIWKEGDTVHETEELRRGYEREFQEY
jgi:hypothetical protein